MSADDRLDKLAHELRIEFDRGFAVRPSPSDDASEPLLCVRVSERAFAVPLSEVTGVHLGCPDLALQADDPAFLGLAAIRGTLVPVYGLAAFLGLPALPSRRWLLVAGEKDPIALAFDGIDGQYAVSRGSVAKLSADNARSHVRGVSEHAGVVRSVINLVSVVAEIARRVKPASIREE